MLYRAVLFDCDGVLVDSEPLLTRVIIDYLRPLGAALVPEDFKPFTGMGEAAFIEGPAHLAGIAYHEGMKHDCYDLYVQQLAVTDIAIAGAKQVVQYLNENDIYTALASSADAIKVLANLHSAGLAIRDFDAIINGEMVSHRKPDPEIYIKAAAALGVKPEECIVVEDAIAGLQAAKAAGMDCVCLTTAFDDETLRAEGAIATFPDCVALQEWFAKHVVG